jgi:hypothetical protein
MNPTMTRRDSHRTHEFWYMNFRVLFCAIDKCCASARYFIQDYLMPGLHRALHSLRRFFQFATLPQDA